MSPRPRFTTKIDRIRNAILGVLLRPLRWFSPTTQLIIGFAGLSALTTLVLSWWPFTLRTIVVFLLVCASYFLVWRFVRYRSSAVDLLTSRERAFALVGSAILFQSAIIRFSFIVIDAIASQSTRAPFNNAEVWAFAVPFAAASLLVRMLLDRQLSFANLVGDVRIRRVCCCRLRTQAISRTTNGDDRRFDCRRIKYADCCRNYGTDSAAVQAVRYSGSGAFRIYRRTVDDRFRRRRHAHQRIIIRRAHGHSAAGAYQRRPAGIKPTGRTRAGNEPTFARGRSIGGRCLSGDWRERYTRACRGAVPRYW